MKRGRFFCENCGTEVRPNAKVCPHCGRFFRAVRCPACSFIGEATLFLSGCPNCGYAGEGSRPSAGEGFEVYDPAELEGVADENPRHHRRSSASSMGIKAPPWLFWVVLGVLLVAFGILVIIYLNM